MGSDKYQHKKQDMNTTQKPQYEQMFEEMEMWREKLAHTYDEPFETDDFNEPKKTTQCVLYW